MTSYQRRAGRTTTPANTNTPTAAAATHMAEAKHRFSLAALACIRGDTDAPVLVRGALAEVDAALAELAKITDEKGTP